jgi:S1-C subfamily serine protease
MEDMDETSPTPGDAQEPVDPYAWPRPDAGIPQAEAWPGFNAGMPAPPDFPLPPGPGGPSSSRPPAGRRRAVLAGLVAAALVLSGVIGATGGILWHNGPDTTVSQGAPTANPPSVGASASAVAAGVAPAIVNVNTFQTTFDSTTSSLVPLGAGTGMILSPTGEVLTNNHVVKGAAKIEVTVAGHSNTYTADVVGVDPTDDVALLQLEGASDLPTVSIASASTLSAGQDVIAIGNALGLGGAPSVTQGTISGLHRSITARDPGGESERLADLIQTNAAIQPGDSGGALVNASGQVVGMITAGAAGTDAQTPSTVGFAIPLDNAIGIVSEIRAGHGSSTILLGERGFMGVSINPGFDFSTAPALGLNATSGAYVRGVEPGSPAQDAGLKAPAVIQSVDGQVVSSADDLGPLLHSHVPGDRVAVTWVDANGTHTATVALGPGPAV